MVVIFNTVPNGSQRGQNASRGDAVGVTSLVVPVAVIVIGGVVVVIWVTVVIVADMVFVVLVEIRL